MSDRPDHLYTARWHLLKGLPVPMDGPREAVLDVLRPILGPEPGAKPAEPVVVEEEPPPLEPGDVRVAEPFYPDWLHDEDSGFPVVGYALYADELPDYLDSLNPVDFTWHPKRICIHHTAAPSLAQRPKGLQPEHIENLRFYYKNERGWSAGPHLFVDEDTVWLFTPLTRRGIHAASFNVDAIGIEMLGDFDTEDPRTGRGAAVIETTARAVHHLMAHFGIGEDDLLFHRDDPKTTKTCPGQNISKPWFIQQVREAAD